MPAKEGSQPHLEIAGQLDSEGRYGDALEALVRGARAGEPDCATWLGLRLMTGDRAPAAPADGLRILARAWELGHAPAASRAAALLALGVRSPPDWQLALDWLVRAAEKGDPHAQKQLLGLADDRRLAAASASMLQPPWAELAASIDQRAWHCSPTARVLSDEPRISVFPAMLRPELCDVLAGFAAGRLERALVYDANRGSDIVVDAHRSNTLARFGLDAIQFLHVLLQARMAAACRMPMTHFEAPTELHYDVGERIVDHFDFVDPTVTNDYAGEIARNGQRMITFIVYLNDGYGGGETSFRRLGIVHKGGKGEGIYFVNALPDLSPDLRMVHAGEPVTSGEKWIVTQFIRSHATR
jgi:prolyl 4-hydroxylase